MAETHKSHRTGWLRAAVLGANDGIVSTASLIVGIGRCRYFQGRYLTRWSSRFGCWWYVYAFTAGVGQVFGVNV